MSLIDTSIKDDEMSLLFVAILVLQFIIKLCFPITKSITRFLYESQNSVISLSIHPSAVLVMFKKIAFCSLEAFVTYFVSSHKSLP